MLQTTHHIFVYIQQTSLMSRVTFTNRPSLFIQITELNSRPYNTVSSLGSVTCRIIVVTGFSGQWFVIRFTHGRCSDPSALPEGGKKSKVKRWVLYQASPREEAKQDFGMRPAGF